MAVAAGRINLPFVEKNYERRNWGRKEQEFSFILLSLRCALDSKHGKVRKVPDKSPKLTINFRLVVIKT